MAFNRRNFIQKLSGLAGSLTLGSLISPAFAADFQKALDRVASLSPEEGWKGEVGGLAASVGTYIYLARLKMSDGEERTVHGSFILIR